MAIRYSPPDRDLICISKVTMRKVVRKLAAFYRQLLEIESDNNDETHQFILTEGTTLTIYNDGTVKNNLNQNICLAFTVDDIDREYKKVLALGARIHEPPTKRP